MKVAKKIHAFTLNEMLVVLLLTAIVVGMAFAVLQLVQGQIHSIDKNYERNSELNLLQQSLWIDFNQSDGVWYEQKTNSLTFLNEMNSKTYYLSKDFIVKEKDTFDVKISQTYFYFTGETQKEGEIDAMKIITTKSQGEQRVFVYKTNAATTFLN